MYGMFNMLIQNLSNMGGSITDASFTQKTMSVDFTDKEGNKYHFWVTKEEGATNNGN